MNNENAGLPVPPNPVVSTSPLNPASPMSNMNTGVPVPPAVIQTKYAGFWVRFVASVVDGIVISFPTFFINMFMGGDMAEGMGSTIVSLLISWVYYIWLTESYGATLGKMVAGLVVKSDTLQPLSLSKIILRETVGKILSIVILGIGYIMIAFTSKKQGLHDKIANSVVIYKDPSKPHGVLFYIAVVLAILLPTIAVIGIMSVFVLVSLNTARKAGQDSMAISNLMQVRTMIEVDYGKNNSYMTAKDCLSGYFAEPSIQNAISALSENNPICLAHDQTYAVSIDLNNSEVKNRNTCLDSSGFNGDAVAFDDGSKAFCQVYAGIRE